MPANRRFSPSPPDKANELFDKLLATSDTAIKTRERLFADLKEELELLASLQEQHLFPVLRKHDMQDLVDQAVNDNEETIALLAELDSMPKNSGEFLGKLSELRRIFQQHIRDDKKELLPAVLKVLSDEEAEEVVEKVEDEMASIDEAKRAEARRSRDQVESVQRVAEDMAETVRAGAESAQTVARAMQDAVQNSFGAASELARRSTEQAMQVFGRPSGDRAGLSEDATQNLRAIAQSSVALARGGQDVSREWFDMTHKCMQTSLDGLNQLSRCQSPSDAIAIQTALFRDNLEEMLNSSRRIAELTVQLVDEATRTMTVQAEKTAERVRRAA